MTKDTTSNEIFPPLVDVPIALALNLYQSGIPKLEPFKRLTFCNKQRLYSPLDMAYVNINVHIEIIKEVEGGY